VRRQVGQAIALVVDVDGDPRREYLGDQRIARGEPAQHHVVRVQLLMVRLYYPYRVEGGQARQRSLHLAGVADPVGERDEEVLRAAEVAPERDLDVVGLDQDGVMGAGVRLHERRGLTPCLAAILRRPVIRQCGRRRREDQAGRRQPDRPAPGPQPVERPAQRPAERRRQDDLVAR
jgi:hypothetical protein